MSNSINLVKVSDVMSTKGFKEESYKAYIAYVQYIESQISTVEAVEKLSPIMKAFGFKLTEQNLSVTLTLRMSSFTTDHGEKVRKIKSIGTFRNFIRGGWKEVESARLVSNAGKAPAKKMSKAEIIAELEALKAEKAALEAKMNAVK